MKMKCPSCDAKDGFTFEEMVLVSRPVTKNEGDGKVWIGTDTYIAWEVTEKERFVCEACGHEFEQPPGIHLEWV